MKKTILAAILVHERPELAAMLAEKCLRAGADEICFFDGLGTKELDTAALDLMPDAADDIASYGTMESRVSHGNLLPFQSAACRVAGRHGFDAVMMVDSDLVPVRGDAFTETMAELARVEAIHPGRPVVISSRVAALTPQNGLPEAINYPVRRFVTSAAIGLNPLAPALYRRSWSGGWGMGVFNPGTVYNRASIEYACQLFSEVPSEVISGLNIDQVFASEEVFLPTALYLHGCVFHVPQAIFRGIRWRPAWRSDERIAHDLLFVHPVPRVPEHRLWADANPNPLPCPEFPEVRR